MSYIALLHLQSTILRGITIHEITGDENEVWVVRAERRQNRISGAVMTVSEERQITGAAGDVISGFNHWRCLLSHDFELYLTMKFCT